MNVTERTQIWRIQSDLVDGKIVNIQAFSRTEYIDDNDVVIASKDSITTEFPISDQNHKDATDVIMAAITDKTAADKIDADAAMVATP